MEKNEMVQLFVKETIEKALSKKFKFELKLNEELVEKIRKIEKDDINVKPVWCDVINANLLVNYTSEGSSNGNIRTINHEEVLGSVICSIENDDVNSDTNLVHNWYKIGEDERTISYYEVRDIKFGTREFVSEIAKLRAISSAKQYFNRLNMYNSEFDTRVNEYKVVPNGEVTRLFGYQWSIPLKYEHNNYNMNGYVFKKDDGSFELIFDNGRANGAYIKATDFWIPQSKAYKRKKVLKKITIIGSIVLAVVLAIVILIIIGINNGDLEFVG